MRKFKTSISVGDNQLKDVAAGTEPTDGVNVSQLLNNQIWTLHEPTDNIYYNEGRVGVNHDEQYLDSDLASEFNVLGQFSLKDGNGNIVIGEQARVSEVGGNIVIGKQAGSILSKHNLILGHQAASKVRGGQNVVLGNQSGISLESGTHNTIIGYQAGGSDENSSQSVILGMRAGHESTGNSHVIIGFNAGFSMISGHQVIAIGDTAANFFDGDESIVIGAGAGRHAENAEGTIGMGQRALSNSYGQHNIGIGYEVGIESSGTNNILLGYQSGYQSDLEDSIIVGKKSAKNVAGTNNIILGHRTGDFYRGEGNILIGNDLITSPESDNADSYIFDSENIENREITLINHGFIVGTTLSLYYAGVVEIEHEPIIFSQGKSVGDLITLVVVSEDELQSTNGFIYKGVGQHIFYGPSEITNAIAIGDGANVIQNRVSLGNEFMQELNVGNIRIETYNEPGPGDVMIWNGFRYEPGDINDYVTHPDIPDPVDVVTWWEETAEGSGSIRNNNGGFVLIDNVKIDGDKIKMKDSADTNRLKIEATRVSLGLNSVLQTPTHNLHSLNIHGGLNWNIAKFQTENRTGHMSMEQISPDTMKMQLYQNGLHSFVSNELRLVGIRTPIPSYELDVSGDIGLTGMIVDGLGNYGENGQVLVAKFGSYVQWEDPSGGGGGSSLWQENGTTIWTPQQVAVGGNSPINGAAFTVHEGDMSLRTTANDGSDRISIYHNNSEEFSFYHIYSPAKSLNIINTLESNTDLIFIQNVNGNSLETLTFTAEDGRMNFPILMNAPSDGPMTTDDRIIWMDFNGKMRSSYAAEILGGAAAAFAGNRTASEGFEANIIQKINLSSTDYNIGQGFSTSFDRFTAPTPGVYSFHTKFKTSVSSGTYLIYDFRVNGSTQDRIMHAKVSSNTEEYVEYTTNYELLINDQVEIYITFSNSGNMSDLRWSGHLVTSTA